MPFALVPAGFTLKKVTKLQKQAVDAYNNGLTGKAFFDGPASAELVKAVAIVVTPIVLAALAKQEGGDLLKGLEALLTDLIPDLDLSAISKAGEPSA